MEPSLKELRAKAKELRAKVSSAPISKASADQLKSEIAFFERAAKAEASREQRISNLAKNREAKTAPVSELKKNQKSTLVKKVSDTTAVPVPKVRKTKKEKESSDE
jgi:hypothetical protein